LLRRKSALGYFKDGKPVAATAGSSPQPRRVHDGVADHADDEEHHAPRHAQAAGGDALANFDDISTWAGAEFYFEKVRDRNVWDFPLLNVASAATYAARNIERIRVVINAAAARPLRLHAVEAAVVGKPRTEQTAELAGQIAVQGAQSLRYNGYKIPLMRNLVKRAIRGGGIDS